jgi:RNA polymerase sigma-70 factor (ECF subfamily)
VSTRAHSDVPATADGDVRDPQAGDADNRAFFRAEIEQLMDRLYGTAVRLCRDPAEAEDLVAETVEKAWSAFDQLRDRRCFRKWTLRILANTFVSSRRNKTRSELPIDAEDNGQAFSLFDRLHQPFLLWWSNPEQELLSKLLRDDIQRAFDSLPEEFRTVAVLVEIEGCSYAEAAATLQVPIGTVRSRLCRARSMLQRALHVQAVEAGLIHGSAQGDHSHD